MCSKRLKDNKATHTPVRHVKPLIIPWHIKECLARRAGLLVEPGRKKTALMTSQDGTLSALSSS